MKMKQIVFPGALCIIDKLPGSPCMQYNNTGYRIYLSCHSKPPSVVYDLPQHINGYSKIDIISLWDCRELLCHTS